MSLGILMSAPPPSRFPRASGDEPIKRAMQADLEQFSPRERG